jgi:outer membrane beta-barrel protein
MRSIFAALLLASASAANAQPAPRAQAPLAPTEPAKEPAAQPPPATLPPATLPAPPPEPLPPLPPPSAEQALSYGAPLHDPNVRVHVVEPKDYAEAGRLELVLFPVAPQINGRFTQHHGSAAELVFHLQERFALTAFGQYNWYAHESSFNEELVNKVHEEAQSASSLLLRWGALGGVEVAPLYGKFAFYNQLVRFSVILTAGAGVGSTRHQLKPSNAAGPATYAETGARFLGDLGAGVRFQVGERFALRLGLRDLVYTARVDRVNGCSLGDLNALNDQRVAGAPLSGASVGAGCEVSSFEGTNGSRSRGDDVPLAINVVDQPSSAVLNELGVYLGFSLVL